MSRFAVLSAAVLLPLAAGCAPSESAPPGSGGDAAVAPPADHHLHVWSEDAASVIEKLQEAVGQEVIAPEQQVRHDGDDAVAALDSAGIRRGVLLSVAYFFGMPDVEVDDERARVRAENDFVARQARRHPDRLVGFASVNPLADYALEEIERAVGVRGITGLKLHLANSAVDLRDEAHVDRLRAVFARAEELGVPVVIHLYTRHPAYGREDVEVFLEEVLPAAPTVPVQVAHLGGGGGYGDATRGAVRAFLAAFEEDPEGTANVFFELSGTAHPEAVADGDSALLEQIGRINEGVARAVRELGPDRIVYGTDWPAISVAEYREGIVEALPLEEEELWDLMDDTAPYLP